MSFLIPNIFVILVFDIIFLAMMATVSVFSLKLINGWDQKSTSDAQTELEKQSTLVSLIIKFISAMKPPLFFMLIYASQKMSVLPAETACCNTVLTTAVYGKALFVFSVINMLSLAVWLVIDFYDQRSKDSPYTTAKAKFALWLTAAAAVETALFVFTFYMTSVFGDEIYYSDPSHAIGPESQLISALFLCLSYALLTWAYLRNKPSVYYFSNIFFFFSAAFSLVYLTGIYVYQTPVIHCPLCMLSDTYEQAGYFFFGFLFIGTASGLGAMAMKLISGEDKKYLIRTGIFCSTVYFLLSIYYPLKYLLVNGVWL